MSENLLWLIEFTVLVFWFDVIIKLITGCVKSYRSYKAKKAKIQSDLDKAQAMLKEMKEINDQQPQISKSIRDLIKEGEKIISSENPKSRIFPIGKPEVQKFQWRFDGKFQEVEIVIDPGLDTMIPGSQEEFEAMVKKGDAGTLGQLLSELSKKPEREELNTIDKFIFSKKSVEQMRMAGISPDELVVKMLKAAGRM
jgi:hypothetical protein